MNWEEEKARQLQDWILVEAYKDAEARLSEECAAREFRYEGSEQYFVYRHDIYRRFFKLRLESPLRSDEGGITFRHHIKRRLKSAAVLCASVKRLLRDGLIQFPQYISTNNDRAGLLRIYGNIIILTEAGVRKAESLLSATRHRLEQDPAQVG